MQKVLKSVSTAKLFQMLTTRLVKYQQRNYRMLFVWVYRSDGIIVMT